MEKFIASMNAYLGMLGHCNTYKLRQKLLRDHLSPAWWRCCNLHAGSSALYCLPMDDMQQPATKADIQHLTVAIQALQEATSADIQDLRKRVDRLDQKWERLYEADDRILAVLMNMEKQLTGKVESHECRITNLEGLVGVRV